MDASQFHPELIDTQPKQMKAAYHEQYGGSPKHDPVDERFEDGWRAALAMIEANGTEQYRVVYGDDGLIRHVGSLEQAKQHVSADFGDKIQRRTRNQWVTEWEDIPYE